MVHPRVAHLHVCPVDVLLELDVYGEELEGVQLGPEGGAGRPQVPQDGLAEDLGVRGQVRGQVWFQVQMMRSCGEVESEAAPG